MTDLDAAMRLKRMLTRRTFYQAQCSGIFLCVLCLSVSGAQCLNKITPQGIAQAYINQTIKAVKENPRLRGEMIDENLAQKICASGLSSRPGSDLIIQLNEAGFPRTTIAIQNVLKANPKPKPVPLLDQTTQRTGDVDIDNTQEALKKLYSRGRPVTASELLSELKGLFQRPSYRDVRAEEPATFLFAICRTEELLQSYIGKLKSQPKIRDGMEESIQLLVSLRSQIAELYGAAFPNDVGVYYRNHKDANSFRLKIPRLVKDYTDKKLHDAIVKTLKDLRCALQAATLIASSSECNQDHPMPDTESVPIPTDIKARELLITNYGGVDEKTFLGCIDRGSTDCVSLFIRWDNGLIRKRFELRQGKTPYIMATEKGDLTMLSLLRDKSDEFETDDEGRTALIWAASKGNIEVVKSLIGYEIITYGTPQESSIPADIPFYYYIQDPERRKDLLDQQDKNLKTAMCWASANGHRDVVRFLIDEGADFVPEDSEVYSPLVAAARNGNERLVKVLLKGKSDSKVPVKPDVNHVDPDGYSPLMAAATECRKGIAELLIVSEAHLNEYYSLSGDKDRNLPLAKKDKVTPLIRAVLDNCYNVVEVLVKYKADTSLQNGEGLTALELAEHEFARLQQTDPGNQTPVKQTLIKIKTLLAGSVATK